MNLKLLVGIALFLMGLLLAGIGIAGVGNEPEVAATIAQGADSGDRSTLGSLALPALAGVSLAIGGMLIGVSLGNWKRPRTHLEPGDAVVDPEGYHKMKHV